MKWSIMVGAIRSAPSEPFYQHQIPALFAAACAALGFGGTSRRAVITMCLLTLLAGWAKKTKSLISW
jgi:hypothetical protein